MSSTIRQIQFGALPEQFSVYDFSSIAVLPIPYDETSTWMKGADRGPNALLEASANLELYDIETDSEVFRNGIATLNPMKCPNDPEQMVNAVRTRATRVLEDDKFLIGLGGEHTISVGLVQATAERYSDLSVLQLDAHSDTRDEYEGSRYNHACVMSRIGETCPFVQVGIRSMDSSEMDTFRRDRMLFAHEMLNPDVKPQNTLNALTRNVYITIDLDVFDSSVFPSTGTPEPGGLNWYDLIGIIEWTIMKKNVVGFDLTELLPNPANKGPDFLAAKLLYRVLSMVFKKKGI